MLGCLSPAIIALSNLNCWIAAGVMLDAGSLLTATSVPRNVAVNL